MSLPVIFAIAGCIALLVGLYGGGVKAKEIEVPKITALPRILSTLIGIALIVSAAWMYTSQLPTNDIQPTRILPTQIPPSPNPLQPLPGQPILPDIGNFLGTWLNVDPNTKSWTRVEIRTDTVGILSAHFWSACRPADCDAGVAEVRYGGYPVFMMLDSGFETRSWTLALHDNILHITTVTHYTDNSGRKDFTSEDDLHRSGPFP